MLVDCEKNILLTLVFWTVKVVALLIRLNPFIWACTVRSRAVHTTIISITGNTLSHARPSPFKVELLHRPHVYLVYFIEAPLTGSKGSQTTKLLYNENINCILPIRSLYHLFTWRLLFPLSVVWRVRKWRLSKCKSGISTKTRKSKKVS